MAVSDQMSLRIVGVYQGQNIVNTLHYIIETQVDGDPVICDKLCAAWDAAVKADWLDVHGTDYSLQGVKAHGTEGDPKVPGYKALTGPGTVIGDPLPSSVCRTITMYTASAIKRRRGRAMLSGTCSTMIDASDGAVSAAHIIELQVLADLLLEALTDGDNEWALIIPKTILYDHERITAVRARVTPSSVTSRRIRQFLIG